MSRSTLPQLLVERARTTPQAVALREKQRGIWQQLSWAQYAARVRDVSLGLRALGLERGDNVAIIGDNRPVWYIAELAAQAAGAASVGLFQDMAAREVQQIVHHADARIVVVEDQEQVDKLLEVADSLPHVEHVVFWDPKGLRHYQHPLLRSLMDVERLGRAMAAAQPDAFETSVADGAAGDLAVLCYTSGTTGPPKGAMLSHANLLAAVDNLVAIDPLSPGDEYVSFLPCGWIVEQTLGLTASLRTGLVVNFPEEPETVPQDMREIGPHVLLAAPRIWENLVSQVTVKMQDAGWLKRHVYAWGMRVGHARLDRQRAAPRGPSSPWTGLQEALAERLVWFPLRDHLGLVRLRRAYTGGAALGPDTFRFVRALGVNLKQIYGQTEMAGLSVIHRDGDVDPETVGRPIANTEVRIAESGEILSRSPSLFMGYYKHPAATALALRDGWLHSGDAGFLSQQGELTVLDRVSDVIALTDGNRFPPQYIENKLKFSPYIKEAVVLGHQQPYVAAMLNIDLANVGNWAERHGVAYTTYTDLAQKAQVYALIAADVERANADLPAAARVRRFVLLHKELDADDDEITRTRKLRRRVIAERYRRIIDALYEPASDRVRVEADVRYQDGRQARIRATLHLYDMDTAPPAGRQGDHVDGLLVVA